VQKPSAARTLFGIFTVFLIIINVTSQLEANSIAKKSSLLSEDPLSEYLLSSENSSTFFNPFSNISPPITWDKELGVGYLSTAPLISNGIVVVKSPVGLFAYYATNGTELWVTQEESKWDFEMGPLTLVKGTIIEGTPIPPLVITGWSTGKITANSLIDGEQWWQVNTSAPVNGIHGRITLHTGDENSGGAVDSLLIVPIEDGALALQAHSGEERWRVVFPDSILGYRHSVTSFEVNNETMFAMGDEKARVTVWNLSSPSEAVTYSPFEIESGLIRSNIIALPNGRLLLPIQSVNGGALVEWQSSDNTTTGVFELNGPTGLLVENNNLVVVPSGQNTSLYYCANQCEWVGMATESPVTGEAVVLTEETNTTLSVILPYNQNNGIYVAKNVSFINSSWHISNQSNWQLTPRVQQFVTAGFASSESGYAYAICNDASYIALIVNDALLSSESHNNLLVWWAEAQENASSPAQTNGSNSTDNGSNLNSNEYIIPTIILFSIWLIFIITSLVLKVSIFQSKGKWPFTILTTLLLLGMILALPALQQYANEQVGEEGLGRDDGLWPVEWNGTQVIGFTFDSTQFDERYSDKVTYMDSGGQIISQVNANDSNSEIWIGGFSDYSNVLDLTVAGCDVAGLELQYHGENIGVRVDLISLASDGENDRWLLYYEDEILAAIAANANSIDSNATIMWVYA